VAERLASAVGPGVITALALAAALAAAALAAGGRTWPAVALWLVSRLADGLDGPVARVRARHGDGAGDLGGYLDMLGDTVAYVAVPLGVALGQDRQAVWVACAVMLATFAVNTVSWAYLAALLEKRGHGVAGSDEITSVRMPAGFVEGTETIVVFAVALAWPGAAAWTFSAMAVLVAITVLGRLRSASQVLR
jgi:phosphatidylglycerophosphate synthase